MSTSRNLEQDNCEKRRDGMYGRERGNHFVGQVPQQNALEMMYERLLTLENKLEVQNETILKQEREISKLKIQGIENKIIFENKLDNLRDQLKKENSELVYLIEGKDTEINHLKQKLFNQEVLLQQFSSFNNIEQGFQPNFDTTLCTCTCGSISQSPENDYTCMYNSSQGQPESTDVRNQTCRNDPPHVIRRQLDQIKQYSGESLDSYADRVMEMTMAGYPHTPDTDRQTVAVHSFLDGCTDQQAVIHVRNQDPPTIALAVLNMKRVITNRTPVITCLTETDHLSMYKGDHVNQSKNSSRLLEYLNRERLAM